MDQFEYVMVLISIIVGLGIAHLLWGIGGIIDRLASRPGSLKLGVGYFAWFAQIFLWMALFWWWEFRFGELITDWTVGVYFFLVSYAIALFLLSAVIVPRTWDEVADLNEYFLQRRRWFYVILLMAVTLDVADSYLKGGMDRIVAPSLAFWVACLFASVVGLRATTIRPHTIAGLIVLTINIAITVVDLPRLGF